MPARSNAEVRSRVNQILAIADAKAPENEAKTDRYNAAVRIAQSYREADKAGCFAKAFKMGKVFGQVESFYNMFPDEDPTANK